MKVRISDRRGAWSESRGAWFHAHEGCEFQVLAVHGCADPVYEVDVSHLAAEGEVRFTEAYVPAAFAEVVTFPHAAQKPSYAQ